MKTFDWKTTGQWVVIIGAVFTFWLTEHDKLVIIERDLLACQRLLGLAIEQLEKVNERIDKLSERIITLEHG